MVPSSLSRLLPQSTKRVVRETMQRYRLRMAVQRLLKLSRGGAPAPVLLQALRRAWGDEGLGDEREFRARVYEGPDRAYAVLTLGRG